jgi:hypothetical protein
MPLAAASTTEEIGNYPKARSNPVRRMAPVSVSVHDIDSERNNPISRQVVEQTTATDPAHLKNVDRVYNWMNEFLPLGGTNMASSRNAVDVRDETMEGVREEFEIRLGTLNSDDAETSDDQSSQLMTTLRPTRKKTSRRKKKQHSLQELNIPDVIDEEMDEESTSASSSNGRSSKTFHSREAEKYRGAAVTSSGGLPSAVQENRNEYGPALTPVTEYSVAVRDRPRVILSMPKDGEDRSQALSRHVKRSARDGGYSIDNTTIDTSSSKANIMTRDLGVVDIARGLEDSRDDGYSTDPNDGDSVSHATSSATPSELGDHDGETIASFISTIYLN